jgi:hypothetical protein
MLLTVDIASQANVLFGGLLKKVVVFFVVYNSTSLGDGIAVATNQTEWQFVSCFCI